MNFVEAMNNMWFVLNLVEGILFLLLGVYFTAKPEKVSFLITNFDHLPKAQREQYDLRGLSRHLTRAFTLCAVICIVGAVAAIPVGPTAYWVSTALWIGIAMSTMRADNEKLLSKYRK